GSVQSRSREHAAREPRMGEIRLLGEAVEDDDRQPAILVHARQRARPAPVGGAAVAGLEDLAGMVDPDAGVGVVAEPYLDDGFLVAPLVPAIGRGRAHRIVAGLVVVEAREAVLPLGEGPLPVLAAGDGSDG